MPPGLRGPGRTSSGGWFGRVVAALVTCVVLTVAVMFSVVLLAVAAIVVATVLGWLWWNMRRVRRQLRDSHAAGTGTAAQDGSNKQAGEIFDGEVLRSEWKEDQHSK